MTHISEEKITFILVEYKAIEDTIEEAMEATEELFFNNLDQSIGISLVRNTKLRETSEDEKSEDKGTPKETYTDEVCCMCDVDSVKIEYRAIEEPEEKVNIDRKSVV